MQRKTHQYEHAAWNRYDDPMFTPNYEMPTLASKLKRTSRTYFGRFNFRNIPFVVGTSVTPSHNLGMNIQQVSVAECPGRWRALKTCSTRVAQVLSVMKTNQSIANDITPSLFRKVGRGMKPVSSLLEQINCEKPFPADATSQMAEVSNSRENPNVNQDKALSLDLRHMGKDGRNTPNVPDSPSKMISEKHNGSFKQLGHKGKGDSHNHKIKEQSSTSVNRGNKPSGAKSRQQISRTSLHEKVHRAVRKFASNVFYDTLIYVAE